MQRIAAEKTGQAESTVAHATSIPSVLPKPTAVPAHIGLLPAFPTTAESVFTTAFLFCLSSGKRAVVPIVLIEGHDWNEPR